MEECIDKSSQTSTTIRWIKTRTSHLRQARSALIITKWGLIQESPAIEETGRMWSQKSVKRKSLLCLNSHLQASRFQILVIKKLNHLSWRLRIFGRSQKQPLEPPRPLMKVTRNRIRIWDQTGSCPMRFRNKMWAVVVSSTTVGSLHSKAIPEWRHSMALDARRLQITRNSRTKMALHTSSQRTW